MNLPNALTLSRIFIVPLLVVVLLTPVSENWLGVPQYVLGVAIFVAAALTDYFDGKIARSRKQVSKLGKLLDPIADKLLISAALISLVEHQLAPAWAVESFTDPQASVRQSVQRIRVSPFIPHRDEVRGFVYDVDTGELREAT